MTEEKKRGRGQPTKRAPERDTIVLDALRRGESKSLAARLAGVSKRCLDHWCEKDSAFSAQVALAIAQGEDGLKRIIIAAAGTEQKPKDPDQAWKLLRTRFWKKYGERQRIDASVRVHGDLDERAILARLEAIDGQLARIAPAAGKAGAQRKAARASRRDAGNE